MCSSSSVAPRTARSSSWLISSASPTALRGYPRDPQDSA
jgi:hypothetical protein